MEKQGRIPTAIYLSFVEYRRWIRSSKMIILPVLIIVVKNLITDNLNEASVETGYKLSFLEPFVSLTNSGVILLLMPLAFMVLMTDYPQKSLLDEQILMRTTKRKWCISQILFAVYASVSFVLVMLLSTVILVTGHSDVIFDFSKGITGYDQIFVEREYGIINDLLPRNLFNQLKLSSVFLLSFLLLVSYMFFMELVLLFGTIIGKRHVAVAADILVSVAGVAFIETRGAVQWFFPITHTVVWIHFQEYYSETVFPIWGSVLYLVGGCTVLTVVCLIAARKYVLSRIE